ncbi:hypothetical protein SASPL_108303 [Salvia splendens]|uniref:Uncharacterized protein n=1 Tax=Salvia splendens TaxID=180675 RepID=A0A8X8YE32_SALSN|nr:uncharacterized protein LOC121794004 [Salvia splendens]KAG6430240.1 hypothetical protein SASPL_108303 [Salvia splendens]
MEDATVADDIDSRCSTPFVSAPSSPGRATLLSGFYFSAPASPMHFVLSATALKSYPSAADSSCFDFDFSATLPSTAANSPEHMSSADELFFNGQIRPMKLSAHLQRPQILDPLIESEEGRDLKLRGGSVRRGTRSMSPMGSQTTPLEKSGEIEEKGAARSSSKRWILLKELVYRSKSEERNEGHKFWGGLSKKVAHKEKEKKKRNNDGGKRRVVSASAHELHYTAKRAKAEELKKKTFLPYRQGLLGCLGFSSNAFPKAFTTVSSS